MTIKRELEINGLLGFEGLELNSPKTVADQESSIEDSLLETISKNHNKVGKVMDPLLDVISRTHNKIGIGET